MPRGVVNLENLFDLREIFKNPKNVKTGSSCLAYEVINLGTVENPKNVNLGKSYPLKRKRPTSSCLRNIKMCLHGLIKT
jgi:hypothetical protein